MKVYLNRLVVPGPWGGGNNFVKAYHEFAEKSHNVEDVYDQTMNINPDVILLAGLANESPGQISAEQAVMYKMYVKPDVKIVLRVNENDARKGTRDMDDMLLQVSEHIDGTVFVSKWLQKYFNDKGWACKNQTVIVNGVQRSVFVPQPKLNNGRHNIVAHHWSDNYMKGFDIYEKIDQFVGENRDKFSFTYIGRERGTFYNTNIIRPLHGRELGTELGKHDVYVSASRFDPGPNHVLEALSCELPTYVHKDGGGAAEFAGWSHTYDDWDHIHTILRSGVYVPNPTSVALSSWPDCVREYNAFLEATWKTVTT